VSKKLKIQEEYGASNIQVLEVLDSGSKKARYVYLVTSVSKRLPSHLEVVE